MGEMGEWISGAVSPDEGYWEALLRDGENGRAAPVTSQMCLWEGRNLDVPDSSAAGEPAVVDGQWRDAREAMERGEVLELPVVGYNRGGVLVGFNGLRGFVPASHLVNLSPFADGSERRSELRRLAGTHLHLKIIELDQEQHRFVLSERAARLDASRRQELLGNLSPGAVCQGCVTNLCSFGAFVDLGGVEGLVHISELSWGRIDHPSDVLEAGQSVEVYVVNVERERERVGLSIKRLRPDPWQFVEERYHIGQIIEGIVTHVVDFGAFVRVEDGLEGLIHVSELADGNFLHPRNVVREGDSVATRILNIDSRRRRMGLSLRQAGEEND
ncbi:MAG: S1 RNA-binding domain-containing protein [Chloroflexota bacterium]|nr:S1 RNA-binding domain-containing protein [Chloroflexota bacterium]